MEVYDDNPGHQSYYTDEGGRREPVLFCPRPRRLVFLKTQPIFQPPPKPTKRIGFGGRIGTECLFVIVSKQLIHHTDTRLATWVDTQSEKGAPGRLTRLVEPPGCDVLLREAFSW